MPAEDSDVLEFRLPDLGEGLADGELVSWAVAVGDTVELNQTIAEVETAKAVVALPSPFSGVVVELLAQPGDTVPVGAPLIRVRNDLAVTPQPTVDEVRRDDVLVGYGPSAEATSRRRPAVSREGASSSHRASATPGARKLAKELGVDLWFIAGSGPDGAVTVEDVRASVPVTVPGRQGGSNGGFGVDSEFVRATPEFGRGSSPERGGSAAGTGPGIGSGLDGHTAAQQNSDHSGTDRGSGGLIEPTAREERVAVSGIRKRTAAAMVASARTIPQASTFVTIDCTASMELLDHLRTTKSFAELALTPLSVVAKAVLAAIADFPAINASWDEENQQIAIKHFVNLGIAVATDRGLLVPTVKEAHTLGLSELCREIAWSAETARSGDATPADLRGGTFTITNVGVFGVDSGAPLVNPGEAAILSLGAIRRRPWVHRDELAIRWVTTLGLSFDHRMIDGELGARFLARVGEYLSDPLTLLSR
ncbi:dihydrolipoamide acetyltransferase family protein [Nocardia camponoti]|uniref:Dihydrolipoamide acetyltransferase component of pyruvate dehydrogenase complex n=1 Tax=Nocardia camponoti TaxID=1616106 RepID=A0A917QLR2_9NOCA|nr:dihydrolipoamide acetyltransferase family protein [Nocardia camponoti]GGK56116.1 dihydrolipoamide acetyltransferase component of pyruvate dehydrogenase complex [Nocardia camponoti]